jgi:hypothetical protein
VPLEASVNTEGERRAIENGVLHLRTDAAIESLGFVGEIGGIERELEVRADLVEDAGIDRFVFESVVGDESMGSWEAA